MPLDRNVDRSQEKKETAGQTDMNRYGKEQTDKGEAWKDIDRQVKRQLIYRYISRQAGRQADK